MPGQLSGFKAEFFKALAHPLRISILDALRDGEMTVNEISQLFEVEAANASQQLAILRNRNIVIARKEGSSVYYSVSDKTVFKLLDVATEPIFIGLMLRNLRERLTVDESQQDLKLEFRPTSKFDDSMVREPSRVRGFEGEFPASSALVDHSFAFKLFRKLEAGVHPAAEMGRFLTDVADFSNTPALLGTRKLYVGDTPKYLLVVMRNASTGSPWPVCNNPRGKYNDPSHPSNNLQVPLWKLLRASTAAPTFFPPEAIVFEGRLPTRPDR